jgi:hypothetical protein
MARVELKPSALLKPAAVSFSGLSGKRAGGSKFGSGTSWNHLQWLGRVDSAFKETREDRSDASLERAKLDSAHLAELL